MSAQPPLPDSNDPYTSPAAPVGQLVTGKPDNYLVWAILATLCCCVPTGIAAIVFAAQVDSKWASGDYAGAQESSEKAKLWSIVSLVVGLIGTLIYVGATVVSGNSGTY